MRRRDASAVHRVPRRRDGRIGGSPLSSCARRDARIGGSPSSSCAVASVGGSPPSSSCRGRGGPLLLLFQLQGCFLLFFFAVSPDLTCSLLLNALHRNHSTVAGSEEGRAKSGGRRRCVSRGSPSLCVGRIAAVVVRPCARAPPRPPRHHSWGRKGRGRVGGEG